MNATKKRQVIRDQLIGAQNKKAFLVEGSDDKEAFRILLTSFCSGWESRWVLEDAGGKRNLLEILEQERDWLGVADLDDWDEATLAANAASNPNLCVLPRFCIENYLILPAELWQAIPENQQSAIAGGLPAFSPAIEADLTKYLRHGALWKVVSPLWSGLRARGFKEALASENSVQAAQDDAEIRRVLDEWSAFLNPTQLLDQFHEQFQQAISSPLAVKLSAWVHGKVFWKSIVNPVMNRFFGQMHENERRKHLLRGLPRPADLQPIFDRLV